MTETKAQHAEISQKISIRDSTTYCQLSNKCIT